MTAHPPESVQRLTLNGEEHRTPAASLLALVSDFTGRSLGEDGRPTDGSTLGIAVAIDGAVAPRGRWSVTPVRDGAVIEVLTAKKGG